MMTVIGWIVGPVLTLVLGWIVASLKNNKKETKALKDGMQAMLRDRMRQSYRYHEQKGYCTLQERDEWEDMYVPYHALGQNGVMDDTRRLLFALPTSPKKK